MNLRHLVEIQAFFEMLYLKNKQVSEVSPGKNVIHIA